jgi:hypothetical protein
LWSSDRSEASQKNGSNFKSNYECTKPLDGRSDRKVSALFATASVHFVEVRYWPIADALVATVVAVIGTKATFGRPPLDSDF